MIPVEHILKMRIKYLISEFISCKKKVVLFLATILVTPAVVYAAIGTADQRRSSTGDYVVPNGAINTVGERRASAGDYMLGSGSGNEGINFKHLWRILKR